MTTTPLLGSLTTTLDDPRSPVRLFLEERFPNIRDIQRRYRENAPALAVPANEANPGTVGTACDWLLRYLVHPQPDVSLALTGGDPGLEPEARRGHPACHVGRDVAALGQFAGGETGTGWRARLDPLSLAWGTTDKTPAQQSQRGNAYSRAWRAPGFPWA